MKEIVARKMFKDRRATETINFLRVISDDYARTTFNVFLFCIVLVL